MIPSVTATLTPDIGLTAAWAVGTSKNTPRKAPNGTDGPGRYLAEGERWPIHWPVYAPVGDAGLCFNLHDVPTPGYKTWGSVSPVHVEWWGGCWHVHREYGGQKDIACPKQAAGVLGLLSLDLTVSRTAGNCRVYWNGVVVDEFGRGPTLNPDFDFGPFVQNWVGAYRGDGVTAATSATSGLALFGPQGGTMDEALSDVPTLASSFIPDSRSKLTVGTPIDPAVIRALWGAAPPPPVDRFAAARVKVEKFRKASPNIAAAFDETFKALS